MSKVQEAALKGLHPTQLTVGMIVVQDKRKHLAGMKPADRQDFMKEHPMPAVAGRHLTRATQVGEEHSRIQPQISSRSRVAVSCQPASEAT